MRKAVVHKNYLNQPSKLTKKQMLVTYKEVNKVPKGQPILHLKFILILKRFRHM